MSEALLSEEVHGWSRGPGSRVRCLGWLLVVMAALANFALTGYVLPYVASPDVNVYVTQPLLWLGMTGLVVWLGRSLVGHDIASHRPVALAALVLGLFQVSVMVLAGLVVGFGHSPYAHNVRGIGLNLWYVVAQLVGLEMARWYLIAALSHRRRWLGLGLSWLLPSLIMIPPLAFTQLGHPDQAFRVVGGTMLPVAAQNVLATYLALVGGPLASMAYRGTLLAFEWFSPILPMTKWTFAAFIGTLAPVLGLHCVRDMIDASASSIDDSSRQRSSGGSGVVLVASCILFLLWFNTGLFGIRPSVTTGISMEPTMHTGDLAITREAEAGEIKVGDVIRYTNGRVAILHRVRDIRRERGHTTFITQGDNNKAADAPVDARQLQGKLVMMIPKVGWLPIYAKQIIGGWR